MGLRWLLSPGAFPGKEIFERLREVRKRENG